MACSSEILAHDKRLPAAVYEKRTSTYGLQQCTEIQMLAHDKRLPATVYEKLSLTYGLHQGIINTP